MFFKNRYDTIEIWQAIQATDYISTLVEWI